jgi:general nucleoside transport system permease protein
MIHYKQSINDLILRPIFACTLGLLFGGLFILLTGNNPLYALRVLLSSGFGCLSGTTCALLTTLQFATPLILLGLSAAVAFRVDFFSIGQAGQMVLGAAAANWAANNLFLIGGIHPISALSIAAIAGLIFALLPASLKVFLNINEIISTIILNSIAIFLLGFIPSGYGQRIPESARLISLAEGTKLNSGLFIALGITALVLIFLWRSVSGYEIRMSGQNKLFAIAGGIKSNQSIFMAMMLSGALAGIAGGIEVLGVHYRFVQNFTGSDLFDGVMVALLGFCHPIAIVISAILIGGVRLAAMTGLSIQLGIPREIGGMIIATMVIIMGSDRLYEFLKTNLKKVIYSLKTRVFHNKKRAGN